MNSSPLVEVISTLRGGQQGSGRKLMHSTQLIAGVYGDTSMYNTLRSSRADGFGALGRQSAAALLNAYSRPVKYAFTPIQVRSKFRNGVVSEDATFKTASEFEAANNALAEEPGTATAACGVQQRRPLLQAASLPPIVESEVSFDDLADLHAIVFVLLFSGIACIETWQLELSRMREPNTLVQTCIR
jgi:hypothetical protein